MAWSRVLSAGDRQAAMSHIDAADYWLRARTDGGCKLHFSSLRQRLGKFGDILTEGDVDTMTANCVAVLGYLEDHYDEDVADLASRPLRALLALLRG